MAGLLVWIGTLVQVTKQTDDSLRGTLAVFSSGGDISLEIYEYAHLLTLDKDAAVAAALIDGACSITCG